MVRATRDEHPMCQSRACCKDIIVGSLQFIREKLVKSLLYSLFSKPDCIDQYGPVCYISRFHEKFVWEIMDLFSTK